MPSILNNVGLFVNALPGAVTQGLIWGIMAIGLYLTYKILELSDLTVDGSFCTGGAVCAAMMVTGHSVWVAMLAAFIAGVLAGTVTGFLHTKCKIPAILAGILTQLGLWTVNMAIMGAQTKELQNLLSLPSRKYEVLVALSFLETVPAGMKPFYYHPILTIGVATAVIIGLLYWFFGTERGASLRATGANEHMAKAQGINTGVNKLLGLMLANGLVALSGSLFAQYQGSAEINMGRGAIVIGLAAIIIGDVAFGKLFKNFALKLLAVSLGAIIYFVVIQAVLSLFDVDSRYLKLFSAIIVAIFLTLSNLKGSHPHKARKERSHA